jgi:DNA-binding LytR/AlgR family response regulator
VKADYKMKKVRFSDIQYVEGMKDYLRIVTKSEKIMTLMSFRALLALLPTNEFARIHKSYVVSLNAIESIEKGKVKMKLSQLPIGELYRESFLGAIKRTSA